MDKKILKQLKSEYEELEISPSLDFWSKINTGLDVEVNVPQKSTLYWWKYAAVVLLFISFGAIFYFDKVDNDRKEFTKAFIKDKDEKLDIDKNESLPEAENLVKIETSNVDSKINSIKKEENLKQTISANPTSISEHIFVEEKVKEKENPQIPVVKEADNFLNQKPTIAERKKVNYTNAEQLLLGRELDKTREENLKNHKQFGVLDASKIKFKRPSSLEIFGFKVFSDSISIE
ncbi:hypothetical protein [Chryseobacterium sp. JAH]|uniref:hypothetical protein n=1 Tax=Chryseobacterium sp. JAH TaxID=1742858 RepID=UPI000740CC38|nr:hypothetical protein [Chryseobacterium sp. JAH]KUJ53166.1 hypothetical protein AR685_01905 [Chryseobacterium sp. JAH]